MSKASAVVRWLPIGACVLVPSVLILPILFSGEMLFGHDITTIFHQQRILIAEAFREGRLPVWDPHQMAGFPLLAGVQAAVFYPPTWLCLLMSAGAFWTLSAWAHLVLAGVFAQRWLERGLGLGLVASTAGALIYGTSGYISGHVYAGHVNYVWAYPWIPALLWRLERFLAGPTPKRGVLLAAVLTMLFLAGVPQFVFFGGLLVLARGIQFVLSAREGRKERLTLALPAAGWLALGLLWSAPQLFPTLELVGQMHRSAGSEVVQASEHSLPADEIVRIALAPVSPKSPEGEVHYFWERCGFLGIGTLFLMAAAFSGKHPQRYLWAGIVVAGFLIALGPKIYLYTAVVTVVPGAGLFRGPGRYLLPFTLGAAALAGCGVEALWGRGRPGLRVVAGGLAAAAAAQLALFSDACIRSIDPKGVTWPADVTSGLRETIGLEGRLASQVLVQPVEAMANCHAAGLDHVGGYEPMMLRRYTELMNVAAGASPENYIVVLTSVGDNPVTDMLGVVAFLWGNGQRPLTLDNPKALPRAWVVNHAVVVDSREERLRILGGGPWDPRKTVLLEERPTDAPPVPTATPAGRAKVVSRSPGEYVLEAENGADAYLVLSEAYYPGWRAEIDGKPAEVLPANHLIQAVRLPPGKHVVRFSYRSRFLALGFGVALLAAMVPVAIVLVRRRRRAT